MANAPWGGVRVTGRPIPVATALVAAGDDESRILLRSLLTLHHLDVAGEARGVRTGGELVDRLRPGVVVAESRLGDGTWNELLAITRSRSPATRFVLVTFPPPPQAAVGRDENPDALLIRPFRIRAFGEALGPSPALPRSAAEP